MESIGQILKAARERRQISMADVSVATKMTSTFVKAIEANDFDALVAPIYARGFIKLYAECVGLDPMPLLKQFDLSSRAVPALTPLPSKVPPRKASVAYAEKLKPPHLQQSGPLPRHGASGKPEQEKIGGRSPAGNPSADGRGIAGRQAVSPAALATAAPLPVVAPTPITSLLPSWSASLLAGRLSAINWTFIARVQWPRFKLPSKVLQYRPLPVIVWRRIFIVAFVVLLIITASLVWEWSHRGLPSTTDACRWLAEPPVPYLTGEARTPTPGR
ncbi:MAG: helix-turn-helix domain-containing protein [Verrucomicrobia bacterium]|nr:helix-turn-helix domain-containing protein [Verrucomicrobiota bacterium]MBU1734125.1 helix-turn-helix domain-containing protein [Verrucomicrobiota bacterium]MBU1857083.1 helix-turn-helix domain-containing protein [Verrucomicrobiota bacterium]